eukprot:6228810-Amphidinium_carterae.1
MQVIRVGEEGGKALAEALRAPRSDPRFYNDVCYRCSQAIPINLLCIRCLCVQADYAPGMLQHHLQAASRSHGVWGRADVDEATKVLLLPLTSGPSHHMLSFALGRERLAKDYDQQDAHLLDCKLP